jgi:hypothetical protein
MAVEDSSPRSCIRLLTVVKQALVKSIPFDDRLGDLFWPHLKLYVVHCYVLSNYNAVMVR